MIYDRIVVGGGAAGFFSAIQYKEIHPEHRVLILEKSASVLEKVRISGGGRCNLTHACFDPKALCEYYPRGRRELLGPFYQFGPRETIAWFSSHGVAVKQESDGRIFPVSDSSVSIIDCLMQQAKWLGIFLWTECGVSGISKIEDGFLLTLANGDELRARSLVLATGSGRMGHSFARDLGHTIVTPVPSLFTFKIEDSMLHALSGLSVAEVSAWLDGRAKEAQQGPILITHWGVSGPCIIKLSAWQARVLYDQEYLADLSVDWLPKKSRDWLRHDFLSRQKESKKQLANHSPFSEIPTRLWHYLVAGSGINTEKTWNQLNTKEIGLLVQWLKCAVFPVKGKGAFKEEFVTCGGVSLKEVNFKTMESKVCSNLYLIGELLDIDGVTGGFNFQNAWTTAYIAAQKS